MNDERPTAIGESADPTYSVLAEVSREMVRLYKEQFGRGPTKARTNFAGPDIVISTLENTFTPAELKPAKRGEPQPLRNTRLYFQHATESEFRSVLERILGRKVRAFNSAV